MGRNLRQRQRQILRGLLQSYRQTLRIRCPLQRYLRVIDPADNRRRQTHPIQEDGERRCINGLTRCVSGVSVPRWPACESIETFQTASGLFVW